MPCPICDDTRWKTVTTNGVEAVVRCDCWRTNLVDTALEQSGIPRGYAHCSLANFRGDYESIAEARRKAAAFINRFPVVERGLLFYGAHGVGKTHLAVAVLKETITQKGARGYFYETAKLLKLVRDTYNDRAEHSEMDVLRPALDADILVLDDVGFGKTSEWVQETLGLVVDQRYSRNKPVVMTTNLVDSSDNTDPDSVIYRLGARTRSRLKEMCDWIHLDNADLREVGPDADAERVARWYNQSPASPKNIPRGGKSFPEKARSMARAKLRPKGDVDLKWSGGKAGS